MERTILLVDDDPDILKSTASLLSKRGFKVIEAADAETALSMLRVNRPGLILTDVLLPSMNGYEFVKQVKAGVFTSDIPILVMTGRGQMRESFEVAGVNGFIQKPFSVEELLAKIHEITDISDIARNEDDGVFKKIFILGRASEQDVLNDIDRVVVQSGCEVLRSHSVSDAVAKTVEFNPDAFIVDIQLEGKPSSEFVNIVRRLPLCEKKPIIGFCYYKVADLGNDDCRKQVARVQEDADKFLRSGADLYIGRYSAEGLITALKEVVFKK
jgi:DNA-binding response OmpR family regulator